MTARRDESIQVRMNENGFVSAGRTRIRPAIVRLPSGQKAQDGHDPTLGMAEFTDRHVGKRVVDQDGTQLGEVTGVENGRLRVTIVEGADRDTIDQLNWDYITNQETHRLNDRYVSNIDEDTVRLGV